MVITRQLIPVVMPGLCKEDITGVGHTALVYGVQAHHCHVEEHLSSVTCINQTLESVSGENVAQGQICLW